MVGRVYLVIYEAIVYVNDRRYLPQFMYEIGNPQYPRWGAPKNSWISTYPGSGALLISPWFTSSTASHTCQVLLSGSPIFPKCNEMDWEPISCGQWDTLYISTVVTPLPLSHAFDQFTGKCCWKKLYSVPHIINLWWVEPMEMKWHA